MSWIEVHEGLIGHPKVQRLAECLEIQRAHAMGTVISLWLWAIKYAPHGDLNSFTPKEIMVGADFVGEPNQFFESLKKAGWVDPDGKLHDWDEYRLHYEAFQEGLERRRKKTRDRVRRFRNRQRRGNETGNVTETRVDTLSNAHTRKTRKTSTTEEPPYPPGGGGQDQASPLDTEAKDVGEVVDGFKLVLGIGLKARAWDTIYLRSVTRHAKKLLTLFGGDVGMCLDCIEGVVKHAKERGWSDWTAKTIVQRAGDWQSGRLKAA